MVLRGAIAVFGDHHATNRLPYALGFLLMSVCIFRFVSIRCPATYAAAAMIFPALTGVGYYATEMRAYGLELGAAGVALVAWQEAALGGGGGSPFRFCSPVSRLRFPAITMRRCCGFPLDWRNSRGFGTGENLTFRWDWPCSSRRFRY